MSPYREIIDINMPGGYFSEFLGLFIFGPSDLGWRLYDYSILVACIVACVTITWRYDWIAGLYAGALFALIHASEGPLQTAERDEVMTALLLGGYALTFLGVKNRKSIYFLLSASLIALAATLKPTAIVFEALILFLALRHLRQSATRIWPYVRESLIGTALVFAGTLVFLLWRGSLVAFIQRTSTITRYYMGFHNSSFYFMLHHSTPRGLIVILPLAAFLFFTNRSWKNWEICAILGASILGFFSYWSQNKGYEYHRYPFVAFALLWASIEFGVSVRRRDYRWVGAVGLFAGVFLIAPFYTERAIHFHQSNELATALVKDLSKFQNSELQGKVQCLDGITGCFSALYRLGIKQSTGLMGDQVLFSTQANPVVQGLRDEVWQKIIASPPTFFIETNYWFGERQSMDKITAWPQFATFIHNNYEMVAEWPSPMPATESQPLGYRIYRRKLERP